MLRSFKTFHEEIWKPRTLLARRIKEQNDINGTDSLIISQNIINRLLIIWILSEKRLIKNQDKSIAPSKLFETIFGVYQPFQLLNEIFFNFMGLEHDYETLLLNINDTFQLKIPYIGGSLFEQCQVAAREGLISELKLNVEDYNWNDIINLFKKYGEVGDNGATQGLNLDILGYMYEKFTITLNTLKEKKVDINLQDKTLKLKGENLYLGNKIVGAYYTPPLIANYILESTLYQYLLDGINEKFGTRIKDLKAEILNEAKLNESNFQQLVYLVDIGLKELKIGDIACGSGAFLVSALNLLFKLKKKCVLLIQKYHKMISANTRLNYPEINLDFYLKKEIIDNNLYGVDVQESAIELTKLRLKLSLINEIENTNDALEALHLTEYNLKTGNALFGLIKPINMNLIELQNKGNFKELAQKLKISKEKLIELKAFHWFEAFPEVFSYVKWGKVQGFDIIVGNPPYIENKKMKGDLIHKEFQKGLYETAHRLYDYSILFIERGLDLLKKGGYLGYILPNKFCSTDYGKKIRKLLLRRTELKEILNVSKLDVFREIATYPIIMCVKKIKPFNASKFHLGTNLHDLEQLQDKKIERILLKQKMLLQIPGYIIPLSKYLDLAEKIRNQENIISIKELEGEKMAYRLFGFTKYDKIYNYVVDSPPQHGDYLKFMGTRNIQHFFVDESIAFRSKGFSFKHDYLPFREEFKEFWQVFKQEKLLIKEVSKNLKVAYDPGEYANVTGMYIYVPPNTTKEISIFYLLGILNSKLMNFLYHVYYGTTHMAGGYLNFHKTYLLFLPVKIPSKKESEVISSLSKLIHALSRSDKNLIKPLFDILNNAIYEIYFNEENNYKIINILHPIVDFIVNKELSEISLTNSSKTVKMIISDKNIKSEIRELQKKPEISVINTF